MEIDREWWEEERIRKDLKDMGETNEPFLWKTIGKNNE